MKTPTPSFRPLAPSALPLIRGSSLQPSLYAPSSKPKGALPVTKPTLATTARPSAVAPSSLPTTSSTTTFPTAQPANAATVPKYGQCAGINYKGPTLCAAGSKCTYQNPWYSQCT